MKISLKTAWVDRSQFGFGWTLYALFDRGFEAPIGLVWGLRQATGDAQGKQAKATTFQVYHSYVLPWARRQGVRRKINDSILEDNTRIVTACGASPAARTFLRKDYKFNRELGVWFRGRKR